MDLKTKKNFKDNRVAILVVGYDGYESLWPPFFELLRKNWIDCPFKIYLVTNELQPNFFNVEVIKTKSNFQWSKKVRTALKYIKEDYIIMLLEDFFICYDVDTLSVLKCIEFSFENNIKYVKMPYYGLNEKRNSKFKDSDIYYSILQNEKYGISLLPGLWEKNFLINLIGTENYNPWKFEVNMIKEAYKHAAIPFTDCMLDNRNLLNIYNGVIQGEFVRDTYKRIVSQGVNVDLSVINLMTKKNEIILMLKRVGIKLVPSSLEPLVKKIANKFGIKFVSDINSNM
ncbi:hypothetical protein [Enterococcus cecorum]|uniref:hypothetical protein n=1 Tax=Enterococcus cecorum TaxID=44008 RepID=UPI000AAA2CB4|nr:hypothetical protein [Enterococcus cecorum]MDZ5561310.1 hypothetical protein [Enterococcus cecorum]CAI3427832.1 hypothetical protein CIRMBP1220_01768 [Enterococcus cecorum]CAI3433160.1 hypothetical protein CIRMBP1307_01218 [Enterococcus cecorum]STP86551.1 Uncharacterised protein [Enterococcus cecorum]